MGNKNTEKHKRNKQNRRNNKNGIVKRNDNLCKICGDCEVTLINEDTCPDCRRMEAERELSIYFD